MLYNIESSAFIRKVSAWYQLILLYLRRKVDAVYPNYTQGPEVFVEKQLSIFKKYGLVDHITYQSFDWRTIKFVGMEYRQWLPALILFVSVKGKVAQPRDISACRVSSSRVASRIPISTLILCF